MMLGKKIAGWELTLEIRYCQDDEKQPCGEDPKEEQHQDKFWGSEAFQNTSIPHGMAVGILNQNIITDGIEHLKIETAAIWTDGRAEGVTEQRKVPVQGENIVEAPKTKSAGDKNPLQLSASLEAVVARLGKQEGKTVLNPTEGKGTVLGRRNGRGSGDAGEYVVESELETVTCQEAATHDDRDLNTKKQKVLRKASKNSAVPITVLGKRGDRKQEFYAAEEEAKEGDNTDQKKKIKGTDADEGKTEGENDGGQEATGTGAPGKLVDADDGAHQEP